MHNNHNIEQRLKAVKELKENNDGGEIMDAIDLVAIIGAAAWTPIIITWMQKALTQPKVSLHLHSQPEIGYTTLGPIFNVTFALLSEKKDAILNKFSATLKHESGASYTFDWAGLSEALSEIENPIGPLMSIKKTILPLVVTAIRDSHEWRSLKPYIGLFRNYWRFHAPIDEIPLNTVVVSFNDKRACHFLHTLFVIKVGVLSA